MKNTIIVSIVSLFFLTTASYATNTTIHHRKLNREVAANVIKISKPSIAKVHANESTTAAFMDIENTGKSSHKIIAAVSPVAKQTQLHTTKEKNGKIQMMPISNIKISAHHEKRLRSGYIHIMLIGLKEKLTINKPIPIILVFSDGSNLLVEASLKPQRKTIS